MPSERASQFTALMDDIQSFRHYIQAERGLAKSSGGEYAADCAVSVL